MREYERTHPWITFQLDLGCLTHHDWLLLGEAQSKCGHLAGAPLRPDVARELLAVTLTKGIHGTVSIEGNTLSVEEVRARLEGDLPLPESREYQGHEIDNILALYNEINFDVAAGGAYLDLTPERIAKFNGQLLEGQPVGDDVIPGRIRTGSVGIPGFNYLGAPAEDCEYLVDRLCTWLRDLRPGPDHPELVFPTAVLRAILAHLYIAWIHPFGDGNGRTARLIEFQLMVEAGIPMPAAHLLSDHYNRTRPRYYQELNRTSKGSYPIEGFVRYALQGFVDELREQIAKIRAEHMDITWEHVVHTAFDAEPNKEPAKRQRDLILDLPRDEWYPIGKLRDLSSRMGAHYAGKTSKTVTRDINVLLEKQLIVREGRGIKANRELVRAFLPVRHVAVEPDPEIEIDQLAS
jgi:Fic family protein